MCSLLAFMSDLQRGRDILWGNVTNAASRPSHELLVGELVEAIGPAARPVFGSKRDPKKIDPGHAGAKPRNCCSPRVLASVIAFAFCDM